MSDVPVVKEPLLTQHSLQMSGQPGCGSGCGIEVAVLIERAKQTQNSEQ